MPALRASEWITLAAFSWFSVLGCVRRRLDRRRRGTILAFGLSAIAITILVSVVLPRWVPPRTASIVRDWVPYLFLFLFYSQGGQFVTGANRELETRLARLDRSIVAPPLEWCARNPAGVWIFTYLELAYLSYYPVLPMSLALLYLSGRQAEAAQFWTVVLLAAYGSCGTLPFIQIRPPRMLGEKWSAGLPSGRVRAFNLWILQRGSIQANTLPSAHVAYRRCPQPRSSARCGGWSFVDRREHRAQRGSGRYHFALRRLVAGTACGRRHIHSPRDVRAGYLLGIVECEEGQFPFQHDERFGLRRIAVPMRRDVGAHHVQEWGCLHSRGSCGWCAVGGLTLSVSERMSRRRAVERKTSVPDGGVGCHFRYYVLATLVSPISKPGFEAIRPGRPQEGSRGYRMSWRIS